jgi:hypothetical protein
MSDVPFLIVLHKQEQAHNGATTNEDSGQQ